MVPVDVGEKDIEIEGDLVFIEELMVFEDIDPEFPYTGASIKDDESVGENVALYRYTRGITSYISASSLLPLAFIKSQKIKKYLL